MPFLGKFFEDEYDGEDFERYPARHGWSAKDALQTIANFDLRQHFDSTTLQHAQIFMTRLASQAHIIPAHILKTVNDVQKLLQDLRSSFTTDSTLGHIYDALHTKIEEEHNTRQPLSVIIELERGVGLSSY